MGSSMREDVFTEVVAYGLQRRRVKAKKSLALGNTRNVWVRPSLDASLETSLDSSPSFNTLDATFPVDFDRPSDADQYVAVELQAEENVREIQPETKQKVGSFDGFHLSSTP